MGLYGIIFFLCGIMGVLVGIRRVSMGLGWNYGGFYGILWDLVMIMRDYVVIWLVSIGLWGIGPDYMGLCGYRDGLYGTMGV